MTAPLAAAVFEPRQPDRPAVLRGDRVVSYGELSRAASSAAAALAARGVVAGDRVVLPAASSPAFVAAYAACHALGAVAVPVDPRLPERPLAAIVERARPRLVARLEELEGSGRAPSLAAVAPEAPADVLFTGGTTGAPKGVVQTHANILAFARGRNAAVSASPDDRVLVPLPLSHGFALGRLRATLLVGGAIVLAEGFFPAEVLGALDRGADALCCVPAGLAALFRLSGDALGEYAGRLRYLETATAPLTDELRERLLRLLPRTRLLNSYGLTETTSSIAFVDLASEAGRRGAVGRAVPGVELAVVDGQVRVRGANVMPGYFDDAERTREVLVDGWLRTSDVGRLDAEGHLHLEGRRDDLINVGGLKVAPVEVEEALRRHPAVADCACVGVADPEGLRGEAVKAFLVPRGAARPGPQELAVFLREHLRPHQMPAVFAWVDALPRTPVGKVRRALLKG